MQPDARIGPGAHSATAPRPAVAPALQPRARRQGGRMAAARRL